MCHNVCLFPSSGSVKARQLKPVTALERPDPYSCADTTWHKLLPCTSSTPHYLLRHTRMTSVTDVTTSWKCPLGNSPDPRQAVPPGHRPEKWWSLDQAWPRSGKAQTHDRRDFHQHVATPANPLSPVSYRENFLRLDVFRRVRLERDVGNLVNFVSFLSPYLTHRLFWAFAHQTKPKGVLLGRFIEFIGILLWIHLSSIYPVSEVSKASKLNHCWSCRFYEENVLFWCIL